MGGFKLTHFPFLLGPIEEGLHSISSKKQPAYLQNLKWPMSPSNVIKESQPGQMKVKN